MHQRSLSAAWILAFALAGCAQIIGFEDYEVGPAAPTGQGGAGGATGGSSNATSTMSATSGTGGSGGAGGTGGAGGGGTGGAGGALPAPEMLVAGQQMPSAIAVGAGFVFWTNQNDGSIGRVLPAGADYQVIRTGESSPCGIVVGGDRIYYKNSGANPLGKLKSAKLDGTDVTEVDSFPTPECILAIDSTAETLFWANTQQLLSTVIATQMTTYLGFSVSPRGIDASQPGIVYWADYVSAMGTVNSIPPMGGTIVELASKQQFPCGVAYSGGHLFWTSRTAFGKVVKLPSGLDTPVDFVTGQANPCGIVADANRIYWVNEGGGEVKSALVAGGGEVTIAANQIIPCSIAIDATHVYWTTCTGGTVMRAPKPS